MATLTLRILSQLTAWRNEKALEERASSCWRYQALFPVSNPIDGPPESPFDDTDDEDEDEEEQEDESDVVGDKDKRKKKKSKKESKEEMEDSKGLKMLKHKKKIVASDKKTPHQALVEFESESACRMATMRALQIFGVLMSGWNEYRPVFSSPADNRSGITPMNVPYGTKVGDLEDEVNRILLKAGLNMKVSGLVPRGVMLTNGRLDLRFPSFVEAAQVIDQLNEHVRKMKRRRALSKRDAFRFNEYVKLKKAMEIKEKNAKKERKKEEEAQLAREEECDSQDEEDLLCFGVDEEDDDCEDDDDDGDDDGDDNEEKTAGKRKTKYALVVSETVEEYFEEWQEAEANMTDKDVALNEVPRPFDVTWTPLPKPKNKHFYV